MLCVLIAFGVCQVLDEEDVWNDSECPIKTSTCYCNIPSEIYCNSSTTDLSFQNAFKESNESRIYSFTLFKSKVTVIQSHAFAKVRLAFESTQSHVMLNVDV